MIHSLFITHWYPTESKPVNGTFIREQALAVSLFNKVTLVHIDGVNQSHPNITVERDGEIIVYRLRYPKPALPKTGWLYRFRGLQDIFGRLSSQNNLPDIIHAHVYSSADLAYFFGRRYHLPAVLTEHASSYPRNLLTKTQAITVPFYLNRLLLLMPVSNELWRHMQRYRIRAPHQVIPNTVDTNLFRPKPIAQTQGSNEKQILMVAMLYPVKGVNHLIQAIHLTLQNGKNVELMIVGDGPERTSLEAMAQQLKIDEKVKFLGVKTKPEIAELMCQARMLALTSNWDNMPSVLIEAMACGLPLVASAVGGIPEIVKPFCGRLVEPGNPTSIAEGIEYILDNPSEFPCDRIARYAQDEFSYQVVGKKISDAYQKVLDSYQ